MRVATVLTLSLLSTTALAGNGPTETVLHSFTGGADGGNPYTGLLAYGGAFYGTTSSFGGSFGDLYINRASGLGTVFKLMPPQKKTPASFSTLHVFNGADGANPAEGSLIAQNGVLDGVTEFGGSSGHALGYQRSVKPKAPLLSAANEFGFTLHWTLG